MNPNVSKTKIYKVEKVTRTSDRQTARTLHSLYYKTNILVYLTRVLGLIII